MYFVLVNEVVFVIVNGILRFLVSVCVKKVFFELVGLIIKMLDFCKFILLLLFLV